MIGLVGLLGCVIYAAAIVTAVAAATSTAYSVYSADKAKDAAHRQNLKGLERAKVNDMLAGRQAAKSLMNAKRMAASGIVLDLLKTKWNEAKAKDLRSEINPTDRTLWARPERNYGTPLENRI